MSSQESAQPSEEELRAAWEEQMRNITVGDVLVQTAVSLINLAGRRLGLGPGGEAERDLEQVRDAVDAVRGLLPVLERQGGEQELKPLRDALSQLQLEYAKLAPGAVPTAAPGAGKGAPAPTAEGEEAPGPAQSSGRLWVPGS
ncbi:MAG: hypothetical protein NVSMB51_15460 [Solirubrobacteraceae bacterium]